MRISETECAEFPCIRVRCIPRAPRFRTAPVHVLTHGAHHSRTRAIRTARTPVPSRAHVLPYRVSGETPEPCATDSVRASLRGERAQVGTRTRTHAPERSRAHTRVRAGLLICAHVCSFVQVTPPAFAFLPHPTIHPTIGHSYTHSALLGRPGDARTLRRASRLDRKSV